MLRNFQILQLRWSLHVPIKRQTMEVQRNIMACSLHHCCGEAISITYPDFVCVTLVTQHAKRISHILLSSVACLAVPYSLTLSYKTAQVNKKRY